MSDMRDERATVEVGGKVYSLARAKMPDTRVTYSDRLGRTAVVQAQPPWIEGSMQGDEARDFYFSNPPEYRRCQVVFGGTTYAGRMLTLSWRNNPSMVDVQIDCLEPAPAAPTLDEPTDPADLDWGTIRSTCAARDWRAAWGVVGTDHTGDATPGEVYLLAVARRASATAAALHHWYLESLSLSGFGARDKTWKARFERIKRIAAWESSARAQYDERGNRRGRLQAAMRMRNSAIGTPYMVGGPFGGSAMRAIIDDPVTITPEWAASYDRLADLLQAAMPAGLSLGYRTAEDDAVTRSNGGVVGVLNNPYLSAAAQRGEITGTVTIQPSASATIAAALERYASLTGNTMNVQGNGRGGIVVTPRNTNPAPRGPQTRKRR